MIRLLAAFTIAATLAAPALAEDAAPTPETVAAPTPEQLAAAKQAFAEGNALYKAGKLAEAIDRLKESFRLSRNVFLLYNIGHAYDQLGQKDMVLLYYRKFLAGAPADAPMRDNVAKRVAALEAENVQASTAEPEDVAHTAVAAPATGTYSKADFKHELVFTVPPGFPVDVTAFVPQDAGFSLELFYRASGDARFISKAMTWRNMELVARIPAAKVAGNSIQYYIEVRDAAGTLVTRSGKSTSPNLINIEQGATSRYYIDFVDEGGEVFVPVTVAATPVEPAPTEAPIDAGPSARLATAKWIATGATVGLVGMAMASYILADRQQDALLADSRACGAPPCRTFDADFGQQVEERGARYETIYKITLGVGAATAVAAGYLWYRDLAARKRGATPSTAWRIAPTVGDDYAGATAAARF